MSKQQVKQQQQEEPAQEIKPDLGAKERDRMDNLIQEYISADATINRRVEDVSVKIRSGFEVLRENAKSGIKRISTNILSSVIPDRLVAVFVDGDETKISELTDYVQQSSIVLDCGKTITQIAKVVEQTYARPIEEALKIAGNEGVTFSVQQYLSLQSEVRKLSDNVKLRDLTAMQIHSFEELESMILFHLSSESFLTDIFSSDILNQVVKKRLIENKIPVFVTNHSLTKLKNTLETFFSRKTSETLDQSLTINKENITEMLKKAK